MHILGRTGVSGGGGGPLEITLTGIGASTATAWLVPAANWSLTNPLVRSLGGNTREAVGGIILLDSSDPDWGSTFDLVIWGSTFQFGAYLADVTLAPGTLNVNLNLPKLSPVLVGSVDKTVGETVIIDEFFAMAPPPQPCRGIVYDQSDYSTICSGTWDGLAWSGSPSLPLSGGVFTCEAWWFNDAWGDYGITIMNVV